MKEKLDLLAYGQNYTITKKVKTSYSKAGYEIETDTNLAAFISENKEITYYVTGCYNSNCDWISFDVNKLEELKKFCELMVK